MYLSRIGGHRMTIQVREYRKVSEGLGAAKELDGPNVVFVVPAREDSRILREALAAGEPMPAAGRPWTMSEFYRKTLSGLEEAGAKPDWRRQVDPPDHWAILSLLLDRVYAEAGETDPPPPGARMPGFVPLLGAQLRELLREETTPEALGLRSSAGPAPKARPARSFRPRKGSCAAFSMPMTATFPITPWPTARPCRPSRERRSKSTLPRPRLSCPGSVSSSRAS